MKQLVILVGVSLLICGTALGQPDPGDVGVFSDPAGTQTWAAYPPVTPYYIYLVAFDMLPDVWGFEASIPNPDPATILILSEIIPAGWPDLDPNQLSWLVPPVFPYPGAGPFVLAEIFLLDVGFHQDLLFCVAPAVLTGGFGYYDASLTLQPFGLAEFGAPDYPNGCWVGNPTAPPPIDSEQTSWGALKTLYD